MLAFLALEAQAEGLFERLPKAGQGREIGLFDAQARVVGVGGEDAGHVLRSGQRRIVEQDALEILQHAFAMLRRRLARMGRQTPELALGLGQREGFQNARLSGRAFADQGEGAEVGDQHHAVPLPVSLHLLGFGHPVDIFSRGLGFDHAARRVLNQERDSPWHPRRVSCGETDRQRTARRPGSPAPRLARLMTQRTLGERVFPMSESSRSSAG